ELPNGTALSGSTTTTTEVQDPTSTLKVGTTVTETIWPPATSPASNLKLNTVLTGGSGGTSTLKVSGLIFTQVAGSKLNDTYNLSYPNGGNVTITRASDGATQTVSIPNGTFSAGQSAALQFTTLGVEIDFTVLTGSFNNTQSASVWHGHSITH